MVSLETVGRTAARVTRQVARLAVTPLVPGDYLDLVAPLASAADLRARVIDVRHETPGSTTVLLKPGRTWRGHLPGQYVRLGFDVDGVRRWRAYSVTSRPGEFPLTITARRMPDGLVSGYIHDALRPGQVVQLDQATGEFVLPDAVPERVLFLTAGSGITPVIGILRSQLYVLRDVVVVHSAPDIASMLFADELAALGRRPGVRVVLRETSREGQLTADRIGDMVPDWRERDTWCCGPLAMVEAAEAHWATAGVPERLHVERFRTLLAEAGAGGTVSFGDVVVDAPGDKPLLEVGEDAGVLMKFGCRMGICQGCLTPMTEGTVVDLRDGSTVLASPEDPQLIQPCIHAAAANCVLVPQGA